MKVDERRLLIESDHGELSIRRQCELLGLHRSNYYYEPVKISEEAVWIMRRIDEIFTECPFYGSRKIREGLRREGFEIGRERVQALMRQMGLRAIYPRIKTSKKHRNIRYILICWVIRRSILRDKCGVLILRIFGLQTVSQYGQKMI